VDLETAVRAQLGAPLGENLGPVLVQVERAARAAWPEIHVSVDRLGGHLAALVRDEADPVAALARLHAADVYLTIACADGDAAALAAIERDFLPGVRSPLSRMGLTASQIDETLQVMRSELFVSRPAAPPRILNYSGRGRLGGWLRAVAARTGLRAVAHPERQDAFDEDLHGGAASDDLELSYMKRTYSDAFQRAFRTALGGLDEEARLLLKQRYRHAMTVEELGSLHGVHAGTISRWVAAARERLVARTRDQMIADLGVKREDVSSILRMIYSELEISLGAIDPS
jgi:RNA polymerase sigma-70 factor, ECF subfamily